MAAAPQRQPNPDRAGRARRASGSGEDEGGEAALPLRLSVARSTLGLELSEPVARGALTIEELGWGLVGVRYPIDLSLGVKQFRSRRSVLERLALRLDPAALLPALEAGAAEILGEPLSGLRIVPRGGGEAGGKGAEPHVSVCLHSDRRALAFDLVLGSGPGSRWIVDAARGVGLPGAPLALALRLVDLWLRQAGALSFARRAGRALELQGIARALCLELLPSLGCRLPEVGRDLAARVEIERGVLRLVLDRSIDSTPVGRRGVRLLGLSDFVREADELLASGDRDGARAAYLEALESSPKNVELLAAIAALDLAHGGRAESALALLEEARPFEAWLTPAWGYELEAWALEQTGRFVAAEESRRQAARLEPDGILAAFHYVGLAEIVSASERGALFDAALARAPTLELPRRKRFELRLAEGQLRGALADAEHLEAAASSRGARARLRLWIGESFERAGFSKEALSWLKRALRDEPDSIETRLALARAFDEVGEPLRGVELLQAILHREPGDDADERLVDEARYRLAALLGQGDLDTSGAIAHLRRIDSRSAFGARARALEGRLAARLGDSSARLRAHTRLLEALELGWVAAPSCVSELFEVAELEARQGQFELAARAVGFLRGAVGEGPSGEAVDSGAATEENSREARLNELERRLAWRG